MEENGFYSRFERWFHLWNSNNIPDVSVLRRGRRKAEADMNKKLIINVLPHETRVAVLEDGTIVELFIERDSGTDIAGNIYNGRVQRVLPGMQAAFIDIGLRQAAFLYVDDVLLPGEEELFREFFNRSPDGMEAEDTRETAEDNEDAEKSASFRRHSVPIEELLREGQEIMVQVAKSPIGTKGARVTCHISLPGQFLVLMPKSLHVGISRRIEDEDERNRLKNIMISLREEETSGYIVRTAAEGVREEKLGQEMAFLGKLWQAIQNRRDSSACPALIHRELTVSLRAVRDLLTHEADQLMVDSEETYEAIQSFLDTFMPRLKHAVRLYEKPEPIFDAFNLEGDITRALKRKVWLKSGGYIVIEHTEALVAIDVNTGRYVGKHNLEETILKTNLEAVKEIAYQIRLRDIGGIIIIDFIDMEKKTNQEKVYNALKEAVKKDRSKTHILPISELGLVQMTRKRVRKSLSRFLCAPCFYCEGEGQLVSGQSLCHAIFRDVIRDAHDMRTSRLAIHVHPRIADLFHGELSGLISSLELRTGKQIVIYPEEEYHLEAYDISENITRVDI